MRDFEVDIFGQQYGERSHGTCRYKWAAFQGQNWIKSGLFSMDYAHQMVLKNP